MSKLIWVVRALAREDRSVRVIVGTRAEIDAAHPATVAIGLTEDEAARVEVELGQAIKGLR